MRGSAPCFASEPTGVVEGLSGSAESASGWRSAGRSLEALLAELVVDLALLGVREDVVGLADLLELLLGPRGLVLVGMELEGQFAVGLFDLVVVGASAHAQNLVVVLAHGVGVGVADLITSLSISGWIHNFHRWDDSGKLKSIKFRRCQILNEDERGKKPKKAAKVRNVTGIFWQIRGQILSGVWSVVSGGSNSWSRTFQKIPGRNAAAHLQQLDSCCCRLAWADLTDAAALFAAAAAYASRFLTVAAASHFCPRRCYVGRARALK